MTQSLDHRHHLESLDGIRGIAILMVFFFHYYPRNTHNPVALLSGLGWLGVDLFFTLSGFLITGILYDTASQAHFFRNFYVRRALRLLPVYFIVVAVIFGVGWLYGERPNWWALPYFLYGSNIVQNLNISIGVGRHLQIGHLWSLALEEQFYFFWPPVVYLLRSRRKVFWGCVVGSAFAIVLRFLLLIPAVARFFPFVPYNALPTRLDSLLLGGLLAVIVRGEKGAAWINPLYLRLGIAAGMACIALCVAKAHTSYWDSRPMALFGYLAAAVAFFCVIALSLLPATWTHRLGSYAPLRSLGRYSYGLYLWHQLPEKWFSAITAKGEAMIPIPFVGGTLAFLFLLAISVAFAVLSYHAIELPCLRLKRWFSYDDEQRSHRVHIDQVSVARAESAV
ncbi:MAG: acyltransferase [Terracidiphilus sp.]|jgi:peptidoglycan/LPS O-acetylase OafA/YrhL